MRASESLKQREEEGGKLCWRKHCKQGSHFSYTFEEPVNTSLYENEAAGRKI